MGAYPGTDNERAKKCDRLRTTGRSGFRLLSVCVTVVWPYSPTLVERRETHSAR